MMCAMCSVPPSYWSYHVVVTFAPTTLVLAQGGEYSWGGGLKISFYQTLESLSI